MLHRSALIRLRWACRACVALTALFSVWVNTLHVQPGNTISLIIAAAPPAFVLGTLEIVTRLPRNPEWNRLQRSIIPLAMFVVAGASGVLSYVAQRHAILTHTGEVLEAMLLPAIVDGFMVIVSMSVHNITQRLVTMELVERAKTTRVVTTSEPRAKSKLTKKEQIAVLVDQYPELPDAEIAKRVGASYGYVNTLTKELRSLNGAELVG